MLNMLKTRWNVCQIRWDTIVILFYNVQKRSSLKKGLNFNINNINKITSQSKLYIDCNDCGTVYVFWLLNHIYKLLNFLQTRTLIPSKQNREKQKSIYIFPQNTSSGINRPSPNKEKGSRTCTWKSLVTIHQKWVLASEVERLVFSVCMNTQFFTFYFNCMTK